MPFLRYFVEHEPDSCMVQYLVYHGVDLFAGACPQSQSQAGASSHPPQGRSRVGDESCPGSLPLLGPLGAARQQLENTSEYAKTKLAEWQTLLGSADCPTAGWAGAGMGRGLDGLESLGARESLRESAGPLNADVSSGGGSRGGRSPLSPELHHSYESIQISIRAQERERRMQLEAIISVLRWPPAVSLLMAAWMKNCSAVYGGAAPASAHALVTPRHSALDAANQGACLLGFLSLDVLKSIVEFVYGINHTLQHAVRHGVPAPRVVKPKPPRVVMRPDPYSGMMIQY